MKFRLIEQACGCSTVRVVARCCTFVFMRMPDCHVEKNKRTQSSKHSQRFWHSQLPHGTLRYLRYVVIFTSLTVQAIVTAILQMISQAIRISSSPAVDRTLTQPRSRRTIVNNLAANLKQVYFVMFLKTVSMRFCAPPKFPPPQTAHPPTVSIHPARTERQAHATLSTNASPPSL